MSSIQHFSTALAGQLGMRGDDLRFGGGIHPAIDAADTLHEPDGIPVQVVIDQPRGVLEVQALGEDIGGDERLGFAERFLEV